MKASTASGGPAVVAHGRAILGDLDAAVRREWLVTNGIGGFAMGTLGGPATRGYHGWLVAATEPPVGRRLLVGGLVERITVGDRTFALDAHEYADGTLDGRGWELQESFVLDGSIPTWRFAIEDQIVERRVWMARGANTTYVRYRLARGSRPLRLAVSALVTDREFHARDAGRGRAGRGRDRGRPRRPLGPRRAPSCASSGRARTWTWRARGGTGSATARRRPAARTT